MFKEHEKKGRNNLDTQRTFIQITFKKIFLLKFLHMSIVDYTLFFLLLHMAI